MASTTRGLQGTDGGPEQDRIYAAVMSMRQAVHLAIKHGDIRRDSVCAGVGMSTSELSQWLSSRVESASWDSRVAEWLKRTQAKAAEAHQAKALEASGSKPSAETSGASKSSSAKVCATTSSATTSSASKSSAAKGSTSKSSGAKPNINKAEQAALARLKQDLAELESYIPWNAVVSSWDGRRAAWARKVRDCDRAAAVAKQLSTLESALVEYALLPEWRSSIVAEWREELLAENSSDKVLALLNEMEEHLRWRAFATVELREGDLKRLLASDAGKLLEEVVVASKDGKTLSLKALATRVAQFNYTSEGAHPDLQARLAQYLRHV